MSPPMRSLPILMALAAGIPTTLLSCGDDRGGTAAQDDTTVPETYTHNTLHLVEDPRDYGCAIEPTVAFPQYGGGAAGNCQLGTMFAIATGLEQALPAVVAATQGSPLASSCVVRGSARSGEGEVPSNCPFTYDALVGTVSGEHQIVEYKVRVEADGTCWPESCEEILRHEYLKSPLVYD